MKHDSLDKVLDILAEGGRWRRALGWRLWSGVGGVLLKAAYIAASAYTSYHLIISVADAPQWWALTVALVPLVAANVFLAASEEAEGLQRGVLFLGGVAGYGVDFALSVSDLALYQLNSLLHSGTWPGWLAYFGGLAVYASVALTYLAVLLTGSGYLRGMGLSRTALVNAIRARAMVTQRNELNKLAAKIAPTLAADLLADVQRDLLSPPKNARTAHQKTATPLLTDSTQPTGKDVTPSKAPHPARGAAYHREVDAGLKVVRQIRVVCTVCGSRFISQRPHARYCSEACRRKAAANRRRGA